MNTRWSQWRCIICRKKIAFCLHSCRQHISHHIGTVAICWREQRRRRRRSSASTPRTTPHAGCRQQHNANSLKLSSGAHSCEVSVHTHHTRKLVYFTVQCRNIHEGKLLTTAQNHASFCFQTETLCGQPLSNLSILIDVQVAGFVMSVGSLGDTGNMCVGSRT
jgi:hypothetical protein